MDQLLCTDLHCISKVTQADGVGEVIGTAGGETTVGHIVDGQLTTSAAASVVWTPTVPRRRRWPHSPRLIVRLIRLLRQHRHPPSLCLWHRTPTQHTLHNPHISFTQSVSSFLKTCPYHLNLCCCTTVIISSTRAVQPVAKCRQSPYLHKPAIITDVILIMTSHASALVLIMTSFATELAMPTVTDVRTPYRV